MPTIDVRTAVATMLASLLCAAPDRAQAKVEVLHAFAGLPGAPTSRLLQASNGLFYGTLLQAGPTGAGAIFVGASYPGRAAWSPCLFMSSTGATADGPPPG